MTRQRDGWSWAGIWIVGVTAAVWSFTSLSALAELVGITHTIALPLGLIVHISWGLPLTIDVLAVVATRVWLRGTAPVEAIRYSRFLAWAAILSSVAGNAYHGWLVGGRLDTVIISGVPAVVIGVLVHLAVLVGRPQPTDPPTDTAAVEERPTVAPTDTAEPRPEPTSTSTTYINAEYFEEPCPEGIAPVPADWAGWAAFDDPAVVPSTEPDRTKMPDTQIMLDARDWAIDLGRLPSRDEMLARYRIGTPRCRRLREQLGWVDAPTAAPTATPTDTPATPTAEETA